MSEKTEWQNKNRQSSNTGNMGTYTHDAETPIKKHSREN